MSMARSLGNLLFKEENKTKTRNRVSCSLYDRLETNGTATNGNYKLYFIYFAIIVFT